ncbi:MAG TPA: GAF domain-containing protein, partial [Candidatus Limnocylindria bacterium]|nr:GAF domain-containing protein [Candidatus Limnocylindria bacterium]
MPLYRETVPIGVIVIRRTEVRPFSDQQVALLKTFADQAVIAIENVRLFKELQERNTDLREALEHQTATAEVLGIISRSPTDVQPVLDAIVESAARVCRIDDVTLRLREGTNFAARAHFGAIPIRSGAVSGDNPRVAWIREHGTLHIPDVRAQNDFPEAESVTHYRTHLAVPLRKSGELIGALIGRRTEVCAFTAAEIALLETFADQAVIAIENVRLFNELKESLEQQTATSEILGVIASSPTDIQPVLDTIAKSAARICGANDAVIRLVEGNVLRLRAHQGSIPSFTQQHGAESDSLDRGRGWIPARAVLDRETVHIHDIMAAENELPETAARARRAGVRTALATPLLREGVAIGVIFIRRTEVNPFTDKQIALLKTFADQAVIAIENVRLFNELDTRNRQLTEALEQQTATSEILRVIASSPTDVQPVLDAIVQSATRLCEASFGSAHRFEDGLITFDAQHGMTPEQFKIGKERFPTPPTLETAVGRAIMSREVIHIHDIEADPEYVFIPHQRQLSYRTVLAVPLLKEGNPIGALGMWRREVKPFTEKQVALIKTFADQAVIAIENVRLFKELEERNRQITEALEQQTATSEILRVIASSPTDIQPVLDVVAENAARLCEASDALIYRQAEGRVHLASRFGEIPAGYESLPITRGFVGGRAIVDRKTIHVHDVSVENDTEYPDARRLQLIAGARTVLGTPLFRQGEPIGSIVIRRQEVRPFTEKQIKLLETFADQAVIAIENVRLFQERQERTQQLVESVEEMKALSEVGQAVSSTLDLETVLETIVARAVELAGTDCGVIYEYDDVAQEFHLRASNRMEPEAVEALRTA